MNGNSYDAQLFEFLSECRRVQVFVVPTEPHLDCDRQVDSFYNARYQAACSVRVAHQPSAATAAVDLRHRATHVNVDSLAAAIL